MELTQPVAPAPAASEAAADQLAVKVKIVEAIKTIYDPEIPVNIYDMGLIYDIIVLAAGAIEVKMTLTSPGCPEAVTIPPQVETAVRSVPGVTTAKVDVVWDPPWDPTRMSEAAKLQLGML